VAGEQVRVIDPAPAVARQTARLLAEYGWLADPLEPTVHRYFTTGDTQRFNQLAQELLGLELRSYPAHWASPAGDLEIY